MWKRHRLRYNNISGRRKQTKDKNCLTFTLAVEFLSVSSTYGLFLSKIRDFVIELKHFIVSLRLKKNITKERKRQAEGYGMTLNFLWSSEHKLTQITTSNKWEWSPIMESAKCQDLEIKAVQLHKLAKFYTTTRKHTTSL